MKADIHPTYYPNATATCACGATYTVGSTLEKISVEILYFLRTWDEVRLAIIEGGIK